MVVNLTAHPSSFAYRGIQVYPPALCVENAFHSFLHNKGLQSGKPLLVTFNNPEPVFGSVDVSGIALKDAPLDTWAVRAQSLFLEEEGVHLPAGFINRLREPLMSSYLLNSSVCVAEVKTQRGTEFAMVTKSPEIIAALRSQLAPTDRKKRLDHFNSQFSTSYEELSDGSFSTIRLFSDVDGIRLSKQKIGQRSARHLVPYYSVHNYASHLVNILSQRKVTLLFRDDEGVHSLQTTLSNVIVADWLGTTPSGAEVAKWADWCNSSSFGYLSLPNLAQRGHFVSVPILGIEKVTLC